MLTSLTFKVGSLRDPFLVHFLFSLYMLCLSLIFKNPHGISFYCYADNSANYLLKMQNHGSSEGPTGLSGLCQKMDCIKFSYFK